MPLRDKDQIVVSGWWTAFAGSTRTVAGRVGTADQQKQEGATYVISGNLLEGQEGRSLKAFGTRIQQPSAFKAGETADLGEGHSLQVNEDGSYRYVKNAAFTDDDAGRRIYLAVSTPPEFTLHNYKTVLTGEGIGQSFINSLTVTIPATIIPILIAAFAAYALSWMEFPGRALLIALVVGLIVVPLQMSLIPLLRLYNRVGAALDVPSKTYLGIWLAHTAFGMPLAIYLLRDYIAGLPKEIIESARVDGASDFEIFVTHRFAPVLPRARVLRDLPVPVDVERPARRHGLPRNRPAAPGADRRAECAARLPRRQLGNPDGVGLRHHHRYR